MKQNLVKVLSDRDHLLLRGEYILGSFSYVERDQPMLGPAGLEHKTIRYVPALLKMMNEIIDNAVDEAVRTNFKHASHIKVTIDENSLKVEDDGRGIPVMPIDGATADQHEKYMPVVAFTQARAGANFSDLGRETIGMNGVGAFASNVFSRSFKVTTDDGKKRLKMVCTDNCGKTQVALGFPKESGTTVYLEPDFSRFECKTFDDIHQELIRQRLIFLAVTYREIAFSLNGKMIKFGNTDKFLSMFGESFEMIESKNSDRSWFISFFPSPANEFVHFSYVNGLYLSRGGNHVDNIAWEISSRLRDKAARRFPNIKPADIKNRLSLVAFFSRFPDARFDSQTKESLSNSVPDIKAYLEIDGEIFDKLAAKIWRNEKIMQPILDLYQMQEDLKNKKDLEKRKPPKKVVSDNYIPPIGEQKRLFLCEGLSARSGLLGSLGRQGNGFFALRGVPLNAYEVTQQRIIGSSRNADDGNKELSMIIDILQLDLSGKSHSISYDQVVIASDADNDGAHIAGLLIAFFFKFAPWIIEQGRVVRFETPVIVARTKTEITRWWRSVNEHSADIAKAPLKRDETVSYKKGLGSWKAEEMQAFVAKMGLDSMIVPYTVDKKTPDLIKTWMTKKSEDGVRASDGRKEFVGGRAFDLFSM